MKKYSTNPLFVDVGKPLRQVSCGGLHSAVVTDDGDQNEIFSFPKPKLLIQKQSIFEKNQQNLTFVACQVCLQRQRTPENLVIRKPSKRFVIFETEYEIQIRFDVYTWGDDRQCQLGNSNGGFVSRPQPEIHSSTIKKYIKLLYGTVYTVIN